MKPETRSYYEQVVQRAVDRIVTHLDDALELETIAADACLSPFHFHRIFRGMVGETSLELSRRLRLERAAWQLATTDRAVTAIAFDAGYETHEAFSRTFRAAYAASPTGFRQMRRPRIELAATCGVHFTLDGSVPAIIPRDSGGRNMNVTIETMPELRVGAVHHTGPYNQISSAFAKLGQIVQTAGVAASADTRMLAIYHDDPETTPADALRAEAGMTLPSNATMPAGLDEHIVPAGRYAHATHIGPYERLGDVWARLMGEWIPASGERIADGPSYEIYANTPMDTPKDELRTEIYVPLV